MIDLITKTEVLNLDNNSVVILKQSKAGLEKSARDLKTRLDPLTEFEALYKLQYLIKYRMECVKEQAMETFKEKFEGSQTERENGFSITLKQQYEYNYSDKVKDIETEIKTLQAQLTQTKDKQRETARGEVKSEILSLTLK